MPISELIFMGLLGVAGILGFRKGFISQVTMFIGLCLGIWLAIRFAGLVGEYLAPYGVPAGEKGYIISFVVVFAGVVLGVYFLGRFATRVLKVLMLGWVDKLAGLLFGVLKAALILSVLLAVLARAGVNDKLFSQEAQEGLFYRTLSGFAPTFYPSLRNLGATVMKGLQETDLQNNTSPENDD